MSRRAKRLLALGALGVLLLLALLGVMLIPGIQRSKHHEARAEQRAAQLALARQRVRLAADQRPRSAVAPGSHAALRRLPPARLREVLTSDLEASITADARERVARRLLQGPIERTDCSPFQGVAGPPLGKYACTAVTASIVRRVGGSPVGSLGYPFWAKVDFRRLSYVWCKINPKAGEGQARGTELVVPLSPRCRL
jgi:type II secretory pathway pseudopilin PulG